MFRAQQIDEGEHSLSLRPLTMLTLRTGGVRQPPLPDRRDGRYITWSIDLQLPLFRDKCLERQIEHRQEHPEIPPDEPLLCVLDFTAFPVHVHVVTGTVASTFISRVSGWEELMERAREREGIDPLINTIVPCGAKPISWIGFTGGSTSGE